MQHRQPPPVMGYTIVVVAALTFASNNVFAGMSFQEGVTPLTLVAVRTVFASAALAALLWATGAGIRLPRRDRRAALALGILNGLMALALMSAFERIAVGLAVLIFYLYPLLTGVLFWITGQDRLDRGLAAGLAGGFLGLALALDPAGGGGDPAGMALAAAAAVLMAVTIVVSGRVLRSGNSRTVTLHMQVSSSAMFVVAVAVAGDLSLPRTPEGWIASGMVLATYTVAIAAFFAGVAVVGGVRTSLVMNLEPVASIGLGFALLGQALAPHQLVGAAIVLASVAAVRWLRGRQADAG